MQNILSFRVVNNLFSLVQQPHSGLGRLVYLYHVDTTPNRLSVRPSVTKNTRLKQLVRFP
jgi:hypothetical protein